MQHRIRLMHTLSVITLTLLLGALISSASAQDRTITYMLWASDPKDQQSVRETARLFEAEHPGVTVEVLFSTSTTDHHEKIVTMRAAGITPDVFVVNRPMQYDYWTKGYIRALTDWVTRDPELQWDDIINHEQMTMDGEIIGVPHHGGGQQLGFNVALFQEAGLERADEMWRADRWDTDNFVSAVRAITHDRDGDGTPEIYGTAGLTGGHPFLSMLRAFGTTLLDPETGQPTINTPAGRAAIEWVTSLATVYGAMGGGRTNAALFAICPRCVFRDWGRPDVLDFEWNIVPFPKGPNGHRNTGGHNFFAISADTPYPDLAQEFITFNLRPEFIREQLASGAILTPVRISTFQDPVLLDRYDGLNLEVFLRSASSSDYLIPETVKVPGLSDSIRIANAHLVQVVGGEQSPDAAAVAIEDEIVRTVLPQYAE